MVQNLNDQDKNKPNNFQIINLKKNISKFNMKIEKKIRASKKYYSGINWAFKKKKN